MTENNENWKIIKAEDIGWDISKLTDEIYKAMTQRKDSPRGRDKRQPPEGGLSLKGGIKGGQ